MLQIEEYNPYLLDDTGELWERFVRKNFPKNEREEMETWWAAVWVSKVYTHARTQEF